jgi:hypothetical protein
VSRTSSPSLIHKFMVIFLLQNSWESKLEQHKSFRFFLSSQVFISCFSMRNVSKLKVLLYQSADRSSCFEYLKIRNRKQQLFCYCRNLFIVSGFRTEKANSCITSINNYKTEVYLPPRVVKMVVSPDTKVCFT